MFKFDFDHNLLSLSKKRITRILYDYSKIIPEIEKRLESIETPDIYIVTCMVDGEVKTVTQTPILDHGLAYPNENKIHATIKMLYPKVESIKILGIIPMSKEQYEAFKKH